ncbi:MAG: glycoside hydrolase family 5 protein [Bacteroidota bacterium]
MKNLGAIFIFSIFCTTFSYCKKANSPATIDPITPVTPVVPTPEKDFTNSSAVDYYGPLKVSGNRITGKADSAVQLRGMSFFWSQWIGKYYNASVVKWLKDDWYCNVVRAAMAVEEGGYLTNPAIEKQKVFDVVDAAIANGMYVIIDWHDHHASDHLAQATKFFAEIAQKYGDKPNIIYEPYNEPLQVSWKTIIKPYHQAIIDTIRKYDPDNLIICGTSTWSQDVDVAAYDTLVGTNIAYTLHFYAGTHKQALRDKAKLALDKGIALMVTEYGTTDATGDGFVNQSETNLWYNFLDANKLSWCNWSLADKTESSAALFSGSSISGNWMNTQLTTSGSFVRQEMRNKNLRFK